MLTQAMDRNRVKGFLHTEGCRVLNGEGEEVILNGWGFGNWLLCEGYMWMCGEGNRFERPRRIEEVVRELTGSDFAERFWKNSGKIILPERMCGILQNWVTTP